MHLPKALGGGHFVTRGGVVWYIYPQSLPVIPLCGVHGSAQL